MLCSFEYALFLASLLLALLLLHLLLSILLFLGAASLLPPAAGLAYECGFASSLTIDDAINARFYMAAVLFLLFDLELVLMVPALVCSIVSALALLYAANTLSLFALSLVCSSLHLPTAVLMPKLCLPYAVALPPCTPSGLRL